MWDPQKVQADLKSRFGFDDLHAEQILNYSMEFQEVRSLEASHTVGFPLKRVPRRVLLGRVGSGMGDKQDRESSASIGATWIGLALLEVSLPLTWSLYPSPNGGLEVRE